MTREMEAQASNEEPEIATRIFLLKDPKPSSIPRRARLCSSLYNKTSAASLLFS